MHSGPGLCVVYTEEASYNAGRPYCFQVLTPIRLSDSLGSPGSPRRKAHADAKWNARSDSSEGASTMGPQPHFAERFPATNPTFACQWRSAQQQVSLKTGKSFSLTTFQPVQSDVSVGETVREEVGIWAKSLLKALDELRTIAKQVKMELSLTPFQRSRVYGKTRDQHMSVLYNFIPAAQACNDHSRWRPRLAFHTTQRMTDDELSSGP